MPAGFVPFLFFNLSSPVVPGVFAEETSLLGFPEAQLMQAGPRICSPREAMSQRGKGRHVIYMA